MLRVAMVGLGHYAGRVAEAMRQCKGATLAGLVSGSPEKVREWRQKYGVPERNCYTYENFNAIRSNGDINAVYVTTPNSTHAEYTVRAAIAGKHVICEKPLALTVESGEQMVDVCRRAGVRLLVGYRLHFEPKTLEVVRRRQAGEFGRVLFFQGLAGFRVGRGWRLDPAAAGGGSLMDIGIYAVNGARYMVGEEPAWVTAQETKTDAAKFPDGVDETITFQMGFPSGAVASCLSTYAMNGIDRFFLSGDKGFADLQPAYGFGPIKARTHAGEIAHHHVTHQTAQMNRMAGIILEGKTPPIPVDGEEGVRDLRVIHAIYRAAKTGERVVL